EKQIEDFVPKEYWSITAILETEGRESFPAKLVKIDGKAFEIAAQENAEKITADLKHKKFLVTKITREKRKRFPSPPYITSTLQQDAARRFYFSSKKTMMIAQGLYEGVDLGEKGSVGLITYMRTDSPRIAGIAKMGARDFIENNFGSDYIPSKPKEFKSKKAAQEAHEAIRPTYVDYTPDQLKGFLTKDQFRLYQLIWNRFIASQMAEAIFDSVVVEIEAGKYLFKASSSELLFDGFLKVYQDIKEENSEEEKKFKLPALKEKDILNLLKLIPKQHFTKPPPRFTEASLIKELEENGVGRPSTYAQIVTTIKQRKYVESEEKKLFPTELGKTVNEILVKNFPNIFEVNFTATMEEELDKIEEGEENWVKVLNDFYSPFKSNLEKVENEKGKIRQMTQQTTEEICERCGSPMIIRWGKNGRFLACSAFPECKNTKPLESDENGEIVSDQKCEVCGAPMMVKAGRYGKFLSCSKYPECKFTRPFSIGVNCPEEGCKGYVVERKTKRGRVFFGCSNYPKCKFASWDKPVNEICPNCSAKFLVQKTSKSKGEFLKCVKCGYEKIRPAESLPEESAKTVK
ncbi:MAG: type I DNA topoisomerase, partial [candidate division Zixibacteria bacterium]|nr:type I DNA topoisomerase [candidate division Zixibacteria bacterium]